MSPIELIQANAEKLRKGHNAASDRSRSVVKTSSRRGSGAKPAWIFTLVTTPLAFPGGLGHELRLLENGDLRAIELAVCFLEADPWFFRSGYIKADLIKQLV